MRDQLLRLAFLSKHTLTHVSVPFLNEMAEHLMKVLRMVESLRMWIQRKHEEA